MRKPLILILLVFRCALAQGQFKDPTFWENSGEFNRTRFTAVATGIGVLGVGSLIGLHSAWYAEYPQTSFHTDNDLGDWGNMDKVGHMTTVYAVGQDIHDIFLWSGLDERNATWAGGLTGLTYMTIVEIMDGHSAQWGFSWPDMAFNTAGSALFIGQQFAWKEQKFKLKWSFSPSEYAQYNEDVLGSALHVQWLKDYNGQT